MKLPFLKFQDRIPKISLGNLWKALAILITGLIFTTGVAFYTKKNVEKVIKQDFKFMCYEVKIKIETRLKAHAQLLRSGSAFFAASDTVTREEWKKFNDREKINKNLPGIQGVGYSLIIPKSNLAQHIRFLRKNGYSDYKIVPEGEREMYSSIIYLEPFSGSNLKAIGFDMYSDPTRRKAMEIACDSDLAILSDKVILVQETTKNIQAGSLMYVPVYRNGMPANTLRERRLAIKGWVFSPYRMDDLMSGILGSWDLPKKNDIHLKIFDNDNVSNESLLFDNQRKENNLNNIEHNLLLEFPVVFNGKKWTLQFIGNNNDLSVLHGKVLIVLISGIAISLLLFVLSLLLINAQFRTRQIMHLNLQLEKINNDKDHFIYILAHDLKSPFNALLGYADLLTNKIQEYNKDEIEFRVKIINDSANRIYKLLEDILLWARSQSGKLPFNPQNLDFRAICREVIENLKLNATNKEITINQLLDEEFKVYADQNMLSTILHNLVSNAIKFTHKGGQIKIQAQQGSSQVTIVVSDNGTGIDSETKKRLFNISQVYTSQGTENEKGTGLGLLLCKEFVEKNGGQIWVESTLGIGSDFKFTLPKAVTL